MSAGTTPLREAVIAALTTHTGKPRCLQPDRLFEQGRPIDFIASPRQHPTPQRPRCFVAPVRSVGDGSTLALSRRRGVEAVVEVRLWYGGASPLSVRAWDDAIRRAEEDIQLVSAALCYPGALEYAPDGQATGLIGGSLTEGGPRHVVVGPSPVAGELGVVTVVHTFRAALELDAPGEIDDFTWVDHEGSALVTHAGEELVFYEG